MVALLATAVPLGVGGAASLIHQPGAARIAWLFATAVGIALSLRSTWAAVRAKSPSVDVIALLALGGAIAVDEPFAGAVVAVMLTTGVALEARAAARARREIGLLLARSPRSAHVLSDGELRTVPVEQVQRGDRIFVPAGELVPVDGRLVGPGSFDESALTGEPMPAERPAGDEVRSGVVNVAGPVELVATETAELSSYSALLRLVAAAQADSAPFVRLADRMAVGFVPLTLLVAAAAWIASGDPVRAVAVLVVATPCPLLLAAPIAVMSGISRCARIGVIIKGGSALERLGAGRVLMFDKTGTLTSGRPELADVVCAPGWESDTVLRLAASLDQVSPHVLATAIVTSARARSLELELPTDVSEVHGYGLSGTVDGRKVALGKAEWLAVPEDAGWVRRIQRRAAWEGSTCVFAAVDGQVVGVLLLEDPVRPDAAALFRTLRAVGIERTVLVTGDRAEAAETVGRVVGVDAVRAGCDPARKVEVVREETKRGRTIMVGDGINDAPALAAAGVGVALAARGATAASEAADVVLNVDRIDVLAGAIAIARRAQGIARQSAFVGMGLSLVAMAAAALGALTPAIGALVQEVIDVLAILIALRALVPVSGSSPLLRDEPGLQGLRSEHRAVRFIADEVRGAADALGADALDMDPVRKVLTRLEEDTLPHEQREEEVLFPLLAPSSGEAMALLRRSHGEIAAQVGLLRALLADIETAGPSDNPTTRREDLAELLSLMYGLYMLLRLHNAQEDELAFSHLP